MSKITLAPDVSGTGTFTIASPNSNNNRTLTLPDASGTIATNETAGVPSGTKMMFVQTAAPTGWTKDTTHNNKALRVVSGTASTGGTVAFTTAFAAGLSAGNTTLTTTQIPSHNHTGSTSTAGGHQHNVYYVAGGTAAQYCVHAGGGYRGDGSGTSSLTTYNGDHAHSFTTSSTGSSGAHNHTLPDFAVQYVDVIIATKD